ncbi:MAG TPA: outer membrane beta-barrel protein [Blastocatellia bacterium]|nr:outer membrane beta-barrel protein [Blastocatellia bacterium]
MKKLLMVCGILFLAAIPAAAQDTYPSAEVYAGYSYLHLDGGGNGHGFDISVSGNFGPRFGAVADFAYHRGTGAFSGASAYSYLFGPRVYARGERATGFFHALLGGATLSGGGSISGFALGIGGGVDINAGKNIAVRLGEFDYVPARFAGIWTHNFRYTGGIVFKFGEK